MENLKITDSIKQNLLSAAKWLRFLTILGILSFVLMSLCFIACLIKLESFQTIMFGLLCAIHYFPLKKCYYLVEYIRDAMDNDLQDSLEYCAESLNWVLKYLGILAIVFLSFYTLIIIGLLILGIDS